MSIYYILGFIVGMLVAVGFVLVAIKLCRKKVGGKRSGLRSKYDERQKMAQGKAYRAGFWSLLGAVVVAMFLLRIDSFADNSEVIIQTACFIGLIVYIVECTMRDAYMGINDDAKRWTILLAALGAFNLAIVILMVKSSDFESAWLNFLCVVLVLSALVSFGIRRMIIKKEGEES